MLIHDSASQHSGVLTGPLLNARKYVNPSTGQVIDFDRFVRIYNALKPLTTVTKDADGHFLQLWKTPQHGLIGAVLNKNNQLRIIPGNKIQNPLNPGQPSQELMLCLESLPAHIWMIIYDISTLTLTIWPHLLAAGDEVRDIRINGSPLRYTQENELIRQLQGNGYIRCTENPNTFVNNEKGMTAHLDREGETNHSKASGYKGTHVDFRMMASKVREHREKRAELHKEWIGSKNAELKGKVASKQMSQKQANRELENYKRTLGAQEERHTSYRAKWRFVYAPNGYYKGHQYTPKPPGPPTPATRAFQQKVQQNKLEDSYNSIHRESPIASKGATRGEIGGVACSTAYIEGLFDTAEALFEQDHYFCVPGTLDGKMPFSDAELQQILRELAIGIYAHSTIPFFSLHFNQKTDMYPVIHPAYENTLVGRVISMLDYMMKGYLNGAIYSEDFTDEWHKDPDWTKKSQTALEQLTSFYDVCKTLEGKDQEYRSLHEMEVLQAIAFARKLNPVMDKVPQALLDALPKEIAEQFEAVKKELSTENNVLNDFTGFSNSFRIIAKQNSFQKHGNAFVVDSDFDVLYTIVPSPEYKIALETYLRKNGTLPPSYLELQKQYTLFCKRIHDHMVKMPQCKEYFAMLSVINFFSAYFSTLKKHRKIPVLPAISPSIKKGCPPLFPHLPIATVFKEEIKANFATFESVYKKHSGEFKKYFNKICENLLQSKETVESAEREKFVKIVREGIQEPILRSSSSVVTRIMNKSGQDRENLEEAFNQIAEEMVSFIENAVQDGFESYVPAFIENIPKMFGQEEIKNILNVLMREKRQELKQYFLQYRADLIMGTDSWKPDLRSIIQDTIQAYSRNIANSYSIATEILDLLKSKFKVFFSSFFDHLPGILNDRVFNTRVAITEPRIYPELDIQQIEIGKKVVGGCGMRLQPQAVHSTPVAENILNKNWYQLKGMKTEAWTEVSLGADKSKGFAFRLIHEDVPAGLNDDYEWMEALLLVPDKMEAESIERRLELEELMANGKKEDFEKAIGETEGLAELKDRYQRTLMHQAARYADPFYVKTLISHKLPISERDLYGYLPIHYAAMCDSIKCLELFVNHGSSRMVNVKSRDGSTPLTVAIQHDKFPAVRFFLIRGALSSTNADGYNTLHCALHQGNVQIINELLANSSIVASCINEMDEVCGTPLMLACELDSAEIVTKMLNLGADPSKKRKDGMTAIEIAIMRNCVPILKSLLAKSSPTPQAFEIAAREGILETLQLLATAPNFYQHRSVYNDTILHTAIRSGNVSGALFIINNCKDVYFLRETNKGKETAFSLAVDLASWDLIEELFNRDGTIVQPSNIISLLKLEYNPTLKKIFDKGQFSSDQMQEFALVAAQARNYQALTFIFVPNKVSLEKIVGPNGWTISHYLAKSDGIMLLKGLLAKQRDVLQPLPHGKTLPYIAAAHKSYRVLKFLLEQMKIGKISLEKHDKEKNLFCAAIESTDLKTVEIFFEIFDDRKKDFVTQVLDDNGQTALHLAAQAGSLTLVKFFISQGADIKSKDKSGHDILWYALRMKHDEMISFLLKEYPNEFINGQNLYMAAAKDAASFQALIKLNKMQKNLDEAIFLAIEARDIKTFLFLRKCGATFNYVSSTGESPLILASITGQSAILDEILADKKVDATAVSGNNALQHAAKNGYTHCVARLLAAGYKEEESKERKSLIELSRDRVWLKLLLENREKYRSELTKFKAFSLRSKGDEDPLGILKAKILNAISPSEDQSEVNQFLAYVVTLPPNEIIEIDYNGESIWGTPSQLFLRILKMQVTGNCVDTIVKQPGLDPNVQDCQGNCLAHLFLEADQFPQGLKVDWAATNHKGETPLHVAAKHASAATLQAIVTELKNLQLIHLVNFADHEGKTPLFECIRANKEDKAKVLIDAGAGVNVRDHELRTLLLLALSPPPSLKTVKTLLEAGADPNQAATEEEILPIHLSIEMGVHEITRCLISYGANRNIKSKDGRSLVHVAAGVGDTQLLRMLVGEGLSISARDSEGYSPAHLAAAKGKSDTLKAILSIHSAAVNEGIEPGKELVEKLGGHFPKGITPLHLSASLNRIETTQLLLSHRASVENQGKDDMGVLGFAAANATKATFEQFSPYKISFSPKHLLTAAMAAIGHDNLDAVIYLYNKGIPINAELPNGLTGLQHASKNGSLLTTQWLLQQNADVFYQSSSGEDALQISAAGASVQQFALLLEYLAQKLNIDEIRNHRETLMHTAARTGRIHNILHLIKNFAIIDSLDTKGNTPLLTAAENQQSEVVALLLALGANVKATTSIGKSIEQLTQEKDEKTKKEIKAHAELMATSDKEDSQVHLAVRSKNLLAIMVVSHFGDVNLVNGRGKTPLHIAAETGQVAACMHLLDAQADLEAMDADMQTPLKIACMHNFAAAEFLIHAGANRLAKDKTGTTIVDYVKSSELRWKDDLMRIV